jgi:hypothetical protein
MKFQATIVFEFTASSLVDAGHKVDDAVTHARDPTRWRQRRSRC